jgi:hypothetical protein
MMIFALPRMWSTLSEAAAQLLKATLVTHRFLLQVSMKNHLLQVLFQSQSALHPSCLKLASSCGHLRPQVASRIVIHAIKSADCSVA